MGEPATDATRPLARLDALTYAVERGLITGALLVMTLTYFLQIVHREMRAQVNAFDRLALRMHGYGSVGEAPAELLARVTGRETPIVLAVVAFVMALLALRTRARAGLDADAPSPPGSWVLRIGLSVLAVFAIWGFLELVAVTPSRWMCLGSLAVLTAAGLAQALRTGAWAGAAAVLMGAAPIAWFFATHVEEQYLWSVELASVLLMYVGFLGASMATRERKHIRVDAVRKKLPPRHLPLYNAIGGLMTIAFCVFLGGLALHFLLSKIERGGTMQASGLPEWVISLPIAVALAVMVLRFVGHAVHDFAMWRRGEIPEPEAMDLH
ncbi:MAG: TRAP transporter small permease [Deltaproteobacteria bacterium]|nr:TRAP transporter small permease [Deltaproteobacteria bacterium]MCB9785993.1 TRAP transporter small permease [Deltaproteobacteria bacterium]